MREHHREIIGWLTAAGAEDVRLEQGRNHPKVVYRWAGRERYYVTSGTTGDRRAATNAIGDLRRIMGLAPTERRVGERRRRAVGPRGQVRSAMPVVLRLAINFAPDLRSQLAAHPAALATQRARLDAAWLALWRKCMRDVGGKSLL